MKGHTLYSRYPGYFYSRVKYADVLYGNLLICIFLAIASSMSRNVFIFYLVV